MNLDLKKKIWSKNESERTLMVYIPKNFEKQIKTLTHAQSS